MEPIYHKKTMVLADLVLLGVAAIWGGGFVAGKLILSDLGPVPILMYRFCGSAIVIGILFHKRIRSAGKKYIKYGCILGLLQFSGLLVQLVGLQYTTPAKQAFLAATYVIFTPLVAWVITKVRPFKKDGVAAVVTLFGIAMISLNATLQIQIGDPITLIFAFIFSLQIVLTGKFAKSADVMVLTFYQVCFSAVLAVGAVFLTGAEIMWSGSDAMLGIFYIVFINTTLALCLQNMAQKYTKDSHTALLLSLESVFGFVFSVLIYKESVTLQVVTGCLFVLTALFISKGIIGVPAFMQLGRKVPAGMAEVEEEESAL